MIDHKSINEDSCAWFQYLEHFQRRKEYSQVYLLFLPTRKGTWMVELLRKDQFFFFTSIFWIIWSDKQLKKFPRFQQTNHAKLDAIRGRKGSARNVVSEACDSTTISLRVILSLIMWSRSVLYKCHELYRKNLDIKIQ